MFGLFGADEPMLFSGDVLFAGSIGRTDLPGGSMAAMLDSLRTVIVPMDDATVVHCGHGPSTTIARERADQPVPPGSAEHMPLSGFPELLPGQRFVELAVLDRLRSVFELHGFAPDRDPRRRAVDTLLRKSAGEIDKEVYVLRRLHAADADDDDVRVRRCTST